jgi:hypothetical protein
MGISLINRKSCRTVLFFFVPVVGIPKTGVFGAREIFRGRPGDAEVGFFWDIKDVRDILGKMMYER